MRNKMTTRSLSSSVYLCVVCVLIFIYTLFNYAHLFHRLVFRNASTTPYPQCVRPPSLRQLPAGEKYMYYSPHSGFSNQVGELKNALLIAALLNRTLILPPVFDHHAVSLGSCPKFRVHEPEQMRASAWSHISELIGTGRYVAIADIIDISAAVSLSLVKTIDLRVFVSLWCGVDVMSACSGPLCSSLSTVASRWGTLESCGALLSRPEAHLGCVYGVNEDCRTTIWVHGLEKSDIFHPNGLTKQQASLEILNKGLKDGKGKKQYKKGYKDIVEVLGTGTKAARYEVLSFGSLFSSEYKGTQLHVDIHPSMDSRYRMLFEAVKFLPFTPHIQYAGRLYAKQQIRHPFFCAQLRLLDGQFKNHWEKTFSNLKSQLEVVQKHRAPRTVLHVFIMTDLPISNWSGTYLGELAASNSFYKIHIVEEKSDLIVEAAHKLLKNEWGLKSGFLPVKSLHDGFDIRPVFKYVPDILLYVQEIICSCATLGFVGTSGSTIADNIMQLRNANVCTATRVGD